MTERFDSGRTLEVRNPRGARTAVVSIIVILLIVILVIVLIILFRRSSGTTTGGGSTVKCTRDTDCTGTQVCNLTSGTCVDCTVDSDCPSSKPICDQGLNKCVVCASSADCSGARPLCDPILKQCVGCQTSSDCGSAAPICNPATHTCVGCLTAGDCPVNQPICNPASGFCVQCLTNANCTLPATCQNGQCCDTTAPIINTVTAQICPNTLGIVVNYSFGQVAAGVSAIFEISDGTGFVLTTTSGLPATGSNTITISPQGAGIVNPPVFYAGYTYKVRVKLSQPCGQTNYSASASVTIPTPAVPSVIPYVPVISSVQNINHTDFTVVTNPPDNGDLGLFYMVAYLLPASNMALDPNRAAIALYGNNSNAFSPKGATIHSWPFAVATGQQFYVRVAIHDGCFIGVVSNPVLITIP